MRIVQVVTQMEAGGAQRVALLLAGEMARRGHDVETWFLYLKRPGFVGAPGVRVLCPHPPGAVDYLRIAGTLVRRLRAHRADAVITHTHYANVLGQMAAVACGVKRRLAVQHNPLGTYPAAARWADRLLGGIGAYTRNVAVSQAVIDSIPFRGRGYRRRLRRIHNGIPHPAASQPRADARARYGIPPDAPLLVNVGRLAAQKDQAVLLRVLAELPGVHLAIAGEGELRGALQAEARALGVDGRVHLAGELAWADGLSLVGAADVFVLPSRFEAMPLALVEAMRMGVPIIASDIPSVREVMGDAGVLVPCGDAGAIAEAVRGVLDSPETAGGLRERARVRSARFSLEGMVDAYEAELR